MGVSEVIEGCWTVTGVQRTREEAARYEEQDGASMSVNRRDVTVYFADFQDASSVDVEVGDGGEATRYTLQGGDRGAEFRLDFEPKGRGHYLILLRDQDGQVFSAFGSGLPEGTFAAG